MKLASIIFVMAVIALAMITASPEGNQAEEQYHALLEANDGVTYDRDYPESFAARQTRQISWGPIVPSGNFPNEESCVRRCREMDYPGAIYRNRECRCRPQLMRVGVVE